MHEKVKRPFLGGMAEGMSSNQYLCTIVYQAAPMDFVILQLTKQNRATGQHVGLRTHLELAEAEVNVMPQSRCQVCQYLMFLLIALVSNQE